VESVGIYLQRLIWVSSPVCQLCGCPSETTVHLLKMIVWVCTQPKLPLESPLILWQMNCQIILSKLSGF
jgi:hypothetical protein